MICNRKQISSLQINGMSPPPKLRRELFPLYKRNKLDSQKINQSFFKIIIIRKIWFHEWWKGGLPALGLNIQDWLENQMGTSLSLPNSYSLAFYQCQMGENGPHLNGVWGPIVVPLFPAKTFSSFLALQHTTKEGPHSSATLPARCSSFWPMGEGMTDGGLAGAKAWHSEWAWWCGVPAWMDEQLRHKAKASWFGEGREPWWVERPVPCIWIEEIRSAVCLTKCCLAWTPRVGIQDRMAERGRSCWHLIQKF